MTQEEKSFPIAAEAPAQADFEQAAQHLAKFLDSKGLRLTHEVALDALSNSMGYETWCSIRARLASPPSGLLAGLVAGPQYCVDAIYTDNNQLYGDHMDGDSPLDAAIAVMVERLTDSGSMTAVSVTEVTDRFTGEKVLRPTILGELDLEHVGEAVAKLCGLARKNLDEQLQRGVVEEEALDRKALAVEFWTTVSICPKGVAPADWEYLAQYQALDNLIEDTEFNTDDFGDAPTLFTDSSGVEHEVEVVELLRELISLAEVGMDTQQLYDTKISGVYQLLQMKAILEFHEDRLDVVFNGLELRQASPHQAKPSGS